MSNYILAERMQGMSGNVIREILKLTQSPEVISFAGGLPSPGSFPVAELRDIAQALFAGDTGFLQYGTTEGLAELRGFIADWVSDIGIHASADDVLILTGSQQGIDLACKALLDPGDVVLVERPTYLAALQIFRMYQLRVIDVPGDAEGMDPEALAAAAARYGARLVYAVPTFQNPSGISWSKERRQQLVAVAERHRMVILEDDPYGRLRYSGAPCPAVAGLDGLRRSIYLGSFSKIVSPGLRVGYAIAPPALLKAMVIGKQGTDVHTSNLSQSMVLEFARRDSFSRHLPAICAQYSRQRDHMLRELGRHFPAGASWTTPGGGLFIWASLPGGISTTQLLEEAVAHKVAFIPGAPFFATEPRDDCMRLNFSNASVEGISAGIGQLGRVIGGLLPS